MRGSVRSSDAFLRAHLSVKPQVNLPSGLEVANAFEGNAVERYGDEVSYIPGYFPAMYLPRERINREMTEAIQIITSLVGKSYPPEAIMGGFLSANNLQYLAQKENIHVAHAVIWSQYAVDGGGADGSPSYPFYPSRRRSSGL